jgi:hypothetical protein
MVNKNRKKIFYDVTQCRDEQEKTYSFIYGCPNRFSSHIESTFKEEHAQHNASSVGGGPFEYSIINSLHFEDLN